MNSETKNTTLSKEAILKDVVDILNDMTLDWDMEFDGSIGNHTKLVADLSFESIDIVQLVFAIEERFHRRGLFWEELLMIEGRYVDEIMVEDAVAFLYRHLNNQ